jgi:hypothetical protein
MNMAAVFKGAICPVSGAMTVADLQLIQNEPRRLGADLVPWVMDAV